MRIAQIAPLIESVPTRLYGGTERIVSYLTEALMTQSHDVTLFASGQSITTAKLVPCSAQALRLNQRQRTALDRGWGTSASATPNHKVSAEAKSDYRPSRSLWERRAPLRSEDGLVNFFHAR
jgi:hypothetical protein